MRNKKIISLIILLIIVIIIATVIAFNMSNLNQKENLFENNNSISKNLQNNENRTNTELSENSTDDTQTSETNNNQINENGGIENMNNQNEKIKINLIVNNKTFTATLNNNETVRQLVSMFPMTLNMSDLHSNEKYNYLDTTLTTNSNISGRINAGDIKLYGNDCLVVFYESFSNSYSYTDLGRVDNVNAFVSELGSGSVNIKFELAN